MNWFDRVPGFKSFVGEKHDVPANRWLKDPISEEMVHHKEVKQNLWVFPKTGAHMRMPIKDRLNHLYDDSQYEKITIQETITDPLKFKDLQKYQDRIKDARQKTGENDSAFSVIGEIGGINVVTCVFNFEFMGGSLAAAAGEAFAEGARKAVANQAAFLAITASGGARMQEGIISLMQLPKTIIAIDMVKKAKLPYLVLLTDPTTGGVTASFAMLGDIHIAESGAMIGFAGKRVIEQTVREKLPDDFQTAEYLHEHGMVDIVCQRHDIPKTISNILHIIMKKEKAA